MESILNFWAPLAFSIFLVGIALRLGRYGKSILASHSVHRRNPSFPVNYRPLGYARAAKEVVAGPVTHFHRKANRTWSRGYLLYHIAIVTEVTTYFISTFVLLSRMAAGQSVPDISTGAVASGNTELSNLLAIVFGNGEHLQADFLFGGLAPYIVALTWVAVGCAVVGNLHLLYTVLRRRNAAVLADIDAASAGVRLKGRRTWDRLTVRFLIFTIIWTELLARLDAVPGIVYVHAALALALFTLFPFTYLFHIVYNFVAVYYAARRRAVRAIA